MFQPSPAFEIVGREPDGASLVTVLRIATNTYLGLLPFQNWLQHPLLLDDFGIPISGAFNFSNPASRYYALNVSMPQNTTVNSEATICWTNEGVFKPTIEVIYFDGTRESIIIDSIILHVYPEEQLPQSQTD